MDLEVVQGDITEQSAGALVNATNTELQMDSGVAAAFRDAVGEGVAREIGAEETVGVGEVAVTDGYDRDAEWIFHAATMPEGGEASEQGVRKATRNVLDRAESRGIQTLALPALGTGAGGLDTEDGARAIAETVADHDAEAVEEVRIVAYDDEDYETIREVVEEFDSGE